MSSVPRGGAVGANEFAGDKRERFVDEDGVERIKPLSQQKSSRKLTENEQRLTDQLKIVQTKSLKQEAQIRDLQKVITRIGDDLVLAGNSPDQVRAYWSGYKSPQER